METTKPERFETSDELLLAGILRVYNYNGDMGRIAEQWQDLGRFGSIPGKKGDAAFGVICSSTPEAQSFEYLSGYEVTAETSLPDGLDQIRIPSQRYAIFVHEGSVSTIGQTMDAIWQDWVPSSGMQPAAQPMFERYDKRFNPETGEGRVEIWVPITA